MGLGKTVITLSALAAFKSRGEMKRALVVAPKRVATSTWLLESQKWEHLQGLRLKGVIGSAKERTAALKEQADIYVISRDNVAWLVDLLAPTRKWPFDTLVLDELSSFKNPQAKRFKALKRVTGACKRVIGLTGTPAPNGYTDMWSQIYLLDRGERLGKTLTAFRSAYCYATHYPAFTRYDVTQDGKTAIDKALSDICLSMRAKDHLPDLKRLDIYQHVALEPSALRLYDAMAKDMVLSLIGHDDLNAANQAVLAGKLLQMASGAVYGAQGEVLDIHNNKIETILELLEGHHEPVLIFFNYQHEKERLLKALPQAEVLTDDDSIKRWNKGEISILLAHPASCGHGLNLQEGGRVLMWFSPTWSLELYQQANARLCRQGQKGTVRIYHLISKDTIDEHVLQILEGKEEQQDALLRYLKQKGINYEPQTKTQT